MHFKVTLRFRLERNEENPPNCFVWCRKFVQTANIHPLPAEPRVVNVIIVGFKLCACENNCPLNKDLINRNLGVWFYATCVTYFYVFIFKSNCKFKLNCFYSRFQKERIPPTNSTLHTRQCRVLLLLLQRTISRARLSRVWRLPTLQWWRRETHE